MADLRNHSKVCFNDRKTCKTCSTDGLQSSTSKRKCMLSFGMLCSHNFKGMAGMARQNAIQNPNLDSTIVGSLFVL